MDIVVTHGDCGTGGGSGSQVNVGNDTRNMVV